MTSSSSSPPSLAALRAALALHSPSARLLLYSRNLYDDTCVVVYSATPSERLRQTTNPRADKMTSAMPLGADAIEVADFCCHILRGHPRWCSLLVRGRAKTDSRRLERIARLPNGACWHVLSYLWEAA